MMKRVLLVALLGVLTTMVLAQTRTELQPSELQKPIQEYMSKYYKDFAICKVFKVDEKGVITYDVCLSKDKTHARLFFDKEGKFLRKESCTLECCQAPGKK